MIVKHFVSALSLVAGLALQASPMDYVIEGEVSDLNGQTFQVINYDNNDVIGSGEVKNGKLRITGSYDYPAFVRVENGGTYVNCILDSLVIVDFNTHMPSWGSQLSMKLRELLLKDDAYNEEFSQFYNEIKSHGFDQKETGEIYRHLYEKRRPEILDMYTQAIKENDNGIGTAFLLLLNTLNLTSDEWDSIFNEMPDNLKKSPLATGYNAKYQTLRLSEPGKPFIDFEVKDLDGNRKRLSDYVGKGKYVLVDFWASWCVHCKEEEKEFLMPLYEKCKDKDNFMILGIAAWDNDEKTRQSLEKEPRPWPQVMSDGKDAMKLYGFDYLPMIILFGPDGTIIAKNLRGVGLIDCVEENIGQR